MRSIDMTLMTSCRFSLMTASFICRVVPNLGVSDSRVGMLFAKGLQLGLPGFQTSTMGMIATGFVAVSAYQNGSLLERRQQANILK